MKLKLKKKTPGFSASEKDDAKKAKIETGLKNLSVAKRLVDLQTPGAKRNAEPPAPPQVKVKITRQVPKNLTLNSALPTPKEEVKWKARRFTGRHLPTLQCNNCSLSRVCAKAKAGYECAYLPYLESHKVESTEDLIRYMKIMVGNSMRRSQLISIIESTSGGMPSEEATLALDAAFKQLKDLHSVMTETSSDTVEIEGSATLVGQIFGGLKMEKLVQETASMHKDDPSALLLGNSVPLADTDVRAHQPLDISEELVREAILAQGAEVKEQDRKGLSKASSPEIVVGNLESK